MEIIPPGNARRSLEVQTENFHRHDFPILCYAYFTGRMLMISITIYFVIMDIIDELQYPYHWLGFLTMHMILECSVTYSDPLWNWECIKAAKTHIHWIFATGALISGTGYFCFRKITVSGVPNYNSSDITSSNDFEPTGSWHCGYSYWLLSFVLAIAYVAIFFTGIMIIFARERILRTYIHRFHKCGGTLITYSTIVLLACNIFNWLSAPMSWVIFLLTIIAFVLMPIRLFANRSVNR